MPSWNELVDKVNHLISSGPGEWLQESQQAELKKVSALRNDRNVIIYASAFLQKPQTPADRLQISYEDINGLMSVMYGMDWTKGLTLILHTPGGDPNAAETIVQYLWSKFNYIEVIVPTYAMSAGTMIALAADNIIMGRQSQLGPIDPQFIIGNGAVSAYSIKAQFEAAKADIVGNPTNPSYAHLWAPILQSMGLGLYQQAITALKHSEDLVRDWLKARMFKNNPNANNLADAAGKYFNDASTHMSHGKRIDRAAARAQNLNIEDLETNQDLQEAVLTLYHLVTIAIEKGPTVKVLASSTGRQYIKQQP
jgi:ATP-dependent protease ClpP protease subunit